jgi:hypothetical protein
LAKAGAASVIDPAISAAALVIIKRAVGTRLRCLVGCFICFLRCNILAGPG